MKNIGPAPRTRLSGASLAWPRMKLAARSTPPSMSLTHPQGSRAPASVETTYSRIDGVFAGTDAGAWAVLQAARRSA